MDKNLVRTYLLAVKHYLSDRAYYYQKVKNYAKYTDIILSVKPVAKKGAKLGTIVMKDFRLQLNVLLYKSC